MAELLSPPGVSGKSQISTETDRILGRHGVKVTLYQLVRRDGWTFLVSAIFCFLLAAVLSAVDAADSDRCLWLLILGGVALITAGYDLLRGEEAFYRHSRWALSLQKSS